MNVPLLHPSQLPSRDTWIGRALCAQTDPEAFFPEKGGRVTAAVKVCSGCPVKDECLVDTIAHERAGLQAVFGVWGGWTARQRRRFIAQHPRLCGDCPNERASMHSSYCVGCGERRRAETQAAHARRVAA